MTQLSIVANNCWSYFAHKLLNLEYSSPFIDSFIKADEYVKLLKDLVNKKLDFTDLIPINKLDSHSFKYMESTNKDSLCMLFNGKYEIVSPHIIDFNLFKDRFVRRALRINYDNLVFNLSLKDGCRDEDILEFMTTDYGDNVKKIVYLPYFRIPPEISKFKDKDHSVMMKSGNNLIYYLNYIDERGFVEDDPIDDGTLINFMKG